MRYISTLQIFFFLSILSLFFSTSCNHSIDNKNNGAVVEEMNDTTIVSSTKPERLVYEQLEKVTEVAPSIDDTLTINDRTIFISEISEEQYKADSATSKSSYYKMSTYRDHEEKFNQNASRLNDTTILIKLENGKVDSVIDIRSQFDESSVDFTYIDHIPQLHSHLLLGSYYEWTTYLLLDERLGLKDSTSLLNTVSINKAGSRLITSLYDGFAYESGGFIIYDISKGSLTKIAELLPRKNDTDIKWAMSEMFWVSENEIIFKHHRYSARVKTVFARMVLDET